MSAAGIEKILNIYHAIMTELKQRVTLLHNVLDNKHNLMDIPRFELCQLQMRKISELVSLGCVVAHGNIAEVKDSLLSKEYNAEKIIKKLSSLNPNFYPVPHTTQKEGNNITLILKTEGFLTKEELVKTYNDCGSYLHRGTLRKLLNKWVPDMDFAAITEWSNRIGQLLAPCHFLQLVDGKGLILCTMNNIDNNFEVQCVHAVQMGQIPK